MPDVVVELILIILEVIWKACNVGHLCKAFSRVQLVTMYATHLKSKVTWTLFSVATTISQHHIVEHST